MGPQRVLLILALFTSLAIASPGLAAVCFQVDPTSDGLILDVTSSTPEGFFSLAGEFVSPRGPRAALTGGGRLQGDGTASFAMATFFFERFTTCCERYVTGMTVSLSPPDYSSGSALVIESTRNVALGEIFRFGETYSATRSAMPCP